MTGTSFSVTEASRLTPPKKMKAAMTATTMPTASLLTPKALWKASLMELDCTILPIKPSASTMATEKNPARNLPNRPLKAARM